MGVEKEVEDVICIVCGWEASAHASNQFIVHLLNHVLRGELAVKSEEASRDGR